MPFIPAGWSAEDVVRELLEPPRDAYVPFDGLEVVKRPGFEQLVAPAFRQGGFNGVSLTQLGEVDAERVIDETVARYRALGVPFRWVVTPDSRPKDLAERLARRGLVRSELRAVARATRPLDATTGGGSGVTVDEVGPALVEAYTRTMAEGWSVAPGPLRAFHASVLAEPSRRLRLCLARVDGAPAGVAGLALSRRSAYLLGAVVLPPFRRRGVYRALVSARLDTARALGLELATCHARLDSSAPLLERLGFEGWFDFPSFSG